MSHTNDQNDHPPQSNDEAPGAEVSRRRFLGVMGLGAGAVAAGPAVTALGSGSERSLSRRRGPRGSGGGNLDLAPDVAQPERFTRLFPDLPPFAEESQAMEEALRELSLPGGLMDANDPLEVGPIRLITEPDLSPNNRDNPTHTAGATFLGQFLDHDVTRDAESPLGRRTAIDRSINLRTARLDLDSVYGGGPDASPQLYEPASGGRFKVESGGLFEDVPRDSDGLAIIGDSRNDENLIISGLQAAFLLFHNALLDQVGDFDEAQRLVRWHYQWIVVHELLPSFVGQQMVDQVLAQGRQVYVPKRARIPVEWQTSAYRFGHSMVRPSYRANLAGDDGDPFFAFVFDPDEFGMDDPEDLTGGHRAPRRFIGWQTFFDFADGEVKPNKRIDTQISSPLFRLPAFAIGAQPGSSVGPRSLATRNLLRHVTWGIPSGQAVANAMGADVLSRGDLSDLATFGQQLDANTPLWFYILREADVVNDGLYLGPVGGRLVAEVILGMLELDDDSYLGADGDWQPTLATRSGASGFAMTDLLTIAGVDPDSRGQ